MAHMDRVKRIWYLSPMRAAKVQASLRIRAVSPEPSLLAHTRSKSSGTFRQKARSLAPLNGWACAVEICQDGMLEDTNSLDGAHIVYISSLLTMRTTHSLQFAVSDLNSSTDDPIQMSFVMRKPVFGVFDQVRLKSVYSATETSYRLEIF